MLAHYLVAETARARLAPGPLAALLAAAPDAYAVGAQGPDFFFYSHLRPNGRCRSDLSFLAHQQRMSAAVATMLGLAGAAPEPDRSALYAFVCGYTSHLCLDAGAHPWILYWTGDVSRGIDAADGARAMRRHGVLEASLDVMLAAGRRPPGFHWPRSRRLLSLEPPRRRSVAVMWSRVMREVHGVSFSPRQTRAAFRTMAFVYGSMTDRRSPLALLLRAGGDRLDPRGLTRTQLYPQTPHPAAITLVGERREWRAPSRPDEPRSETFAEICDRAVDETAACLRAIEGAAFGGDGVEAAGAALGDRNMVTGVACGDPQPLVAFAPERDELWGET
jgi:hypothetical protein